MLACHPVKGACTQPLTYLGRMWTRLPLRTHVKKTTKSLQNLPLHTGSLLKILLWLLK